jgi:hypothetical protein
MAVRFPSSRLLRDERMSRECHWSRDNGPSMFPSRDANSLEANPLGEIKDASDER